MSNENDEGLPEGLGDYTGWGPKYHRPDGKPLHKMNLNDPHAKRCDADGAEQIAPAEYVAVEARDLTPKDLLDLGKKGLRLAHADELAGHDIPVVKILQYGHGDGMGILKRYGKKRYELWLNTRETEAEIAAELKLRNAELQAKQARTGTLVPQVTTVTVQEPGESPETYVLTPRELSPAEEIALIAAQPQKPGLWARFVAFMKFIFTTPGE